MKQFFCAAIAITLAGCASHTHLSVSDPDTQIFVNGEYVATGSGSYQDRKLAFSQQDVTLRKEGCAEQNHSFRRNERPDFGAVVFAYYLYVPILWTAQYKNDHTYSFECEQETIASLAPATLQPTAIQD